MLLLLLLSLLLFWQSNSQTITGEADERAVKSSSRQGVLDMSSASPALQLGEFGDKTTNTTHHSPLPRPIVSGGAAEKKNHLKIPNPLSPAPESPPLPHSYIHFAHVFKRQHGWAKELSRFSNAGGLLYDLEFLTDENGRRVAAFGYWAGYAGTALALLAWAHQLLRPGTAQGPVPVFDSASALVDLVRSAVNEALAANEGQFPRVIVIGALGRCGTGAVECCEAAGLPAESVLRWDMAETSKGGPFREVAESDIFVNCVYLGAHRVPPFVTFESLSGPGRRLRVICDVSCDPNSENNPIPVYASYSSFQSPTIPASGHLDGPELRIIAIDYLPTLVAREASDEYSSLLLPALLTLDRRDDEGVWKRAERTYRARVAEIPEGTSPAS
ncbi:hypothetical protein UVI_02052950 [Ustilaginoidea virens]|uniref:Saccharopine dehydrogenase [NAD(+), L-lysine-forming] n=1 Tax=Ustilaginoidea virens TaxID=1159556 RepID=A0A1B5L7V6_USTVR|nr:hypothetical protein UVI_02052950 [Ustilaginoidea virens]